jgi:ubiquinone/menaquinone biosynthesis C-methylase UbiE
MTTTTIRDRAFDRFALIVNGPALFNAMVTGIEVGVFDALAERPGSTLDKIADRTGVKAPKLRVLMFSLCVCGVVERGGDGYLLSELGDEFLGHDGPDSWRHILVGWQRIYYPAFAHLTPAIVEGSNTALAAYPGQEATLYERLQHSPATETVLHRAMAAFTLQSMSGLLEHVDLDGVDHLLDIGGGDGTTAIALLAAYPKLRITLLDVPSMAARAAASGHDRLEVLPGDVFNTAFPDGVDAVLCSHFLEVFAPEEVVTIARKANDALRPGGEMLIYGFNASADETSGVFSSRLAVYLTALATGRGMTYPAQDYELWLAEAGFEDVGTTEDLPYEHGLTVGRKAR